MKTFFKYIAITLAGIIALLLAAVVALIFVVNPNDYKSIIEQRIAERTGRSVSIAGDLSLTFFPVFGFSSGPLTLGNPQGFSGSHFLQLSSAKFGIALKPLLEKEVHISTIALDGASIVLEKRRDGKTNWTFPTHTPADASGTVRRKVNTGAPSSGTAAELPITAKVASITIDAVKLTNADIRYIDHTAGLDIHSRNVTLTTGPLQLDRPVPVALSGTTTLNSPQMIVESDLTVTIQANSALDRFVFTDMELAIDATGAALPAGRLVYTQQADFTLHVPQEKLTIDAARTTVYNATITTSGNASLRTGTFTGNINIDAPLYDILQTLNSTYLPEDASALQRLTLAAAVRASKKTLALSDLTATFDETTVRGTVAVNDMQRPDITYNLRMTPLTLDRYLPRKKLTNTQPAPTPSTPAPQRSGDTSTTKQKQALRALRLDGTLRAEAIQLHNLIAKNVLLKTTVRDGKLAVNPLRANMYGGVLLLTTESDARSPVLSHDLNLAFTELPVAPVLTALAEKKHASGLLTLSTSLSGKGESWPVISRTLQGRGSLKLTDGVIYGFQILPDKAKSQLRSANQRELQALDNVDTNTRQQPIDNLSASWVINKGNLVNRDLLVTSRGLTAKGRGNVNLVTNAINYRGDVSVSGAPTIPFTVTGTITAPRYSVDVGSLLQNLIPFTDLLFGGSGRKQGSNTGEANLDSKEQPRSQPESPEEVLQNFGKQLEKQLGDELQKGLKNLFR